MYLIGVVPSASTSCYPNMISCRNNNNSQQLSFRLFLSPTHPFNFLKARKGPTIFLVIWATVIAYLMTILLSCSSVTEDSHKLWLIPKLSSLVFWVVAIICLNFIWFYLNVWALALVLRRGLR